MRLWTGSEKLDQQLVNKIFVKYKIEGLCKKLFTIINTVVEITIQYPSSEAMILHERLYNRRYLHLK